jgi:hypothetical protein
MHKHLKFTFVVQNRDYRQYNTAEQVTSIKSQDKKINKKEQTMLQDELKYFRNTLHLEFEQKLDIIKKHIKL